MAQQPSDSLAPETIKEGEASHIPDTELNGAQTLTNEGSLPAVLMPLSKGGKSLEFDLDQEQARVRGENELLFAKGIEEILEKAFLNGWNQGQVEKAILALTKRGNFKDQISHEQAVVIWGKVAQMKGIADKIQPDIVSPEPDIVSPDFTKDYLARNNAQAALAVSKTLPATGDAALEAVVLPPAPPSVPNEKVDDDAPTQANPRPQPAASADDQAEVLNPSPAPVGVSPMAYSVAPAQAVAAVAAQVSSPNNSGTLVEQALDAAHQRAIDTGGAKKPEPEPESPRGKAEEAFAKIYQATLKEIHGQNLSSNAAHVSDEEAKKQALAKAADAFYTVLAYQKAIKAGATPEEAREKARTPAKPDDATMAKYGESVSVFHKVHGIVKEAHEKDPLKPRSADLQRAKEAQAAQARDIAEAHALAHMNGSEGLVTKLEEDIQKAHVDSAQQIANSQQQQQAQAQQAVPAPAQADQHAQAAANQPPVSAASQPAPHTPAPRALGPRPTASPTLVSAASPDAANDGVRREPSVVVLGSRAGAPASPAPAAAPRPTSGTFPSPAAAPAAAVQASTAEIRVVQGPEQQLPEPSGRSYARPRIPARAVSRVSQRITGAAPQQPSL